MSHKGGTMSITYAQNSCFVKTPPMIEIDGKNYTYVKAGNLLIINQEIDFEMESGKEGSKHLYNGVPFYFDQDSYVTNKINAALSNNPGWRKINSSDISVLNSSFGFGMLATTWPGGTNATGVNFPYCPDVNAGVLNFWYENDQWGNYYSAYISESNGTISTGKHSPTTWQLVRFVKDVT